MNQVQNFCLCLGTDSFTAQDVIQFLHNSSWIDSNTRAVVVEFNLYNPNLNLWGVCMYLIEFLQTGGIVWEVQDSVQNNQNNWFLQFGVISLERLVSVVLYLKLGGWEECQDNTWHVLNPQPPDVLCCPDLSAALFFKFLFGFPK